MSLAIHTSILLPHTTSAFASRYTANVVELQTIIVNEAKAAKDKIKRDEDLNPEFKMRSVMMSKQYVNGARNNICQAEKGPWRDIVTAL
jgi:hypothetical protein